MGWSNILSSLLSPRISLQDTLEFLGLARQDNPDVEFVAMGEPRLFEPERNGSEFRTNFAVPAITLAGTIVVGSLTLNDHQLCQVAAFLKTFNFYSGRFPSSGTTAFEIASRERRAGSLIYQRLMNIYTQAEQAGNTATQSAVNNAFARVRQLMSNGGSGRQVHADSGARTFQYSAVQEEIARARTPQQKVLHHAAHVEAVGNGRGVDQSHLDDLVERADTGSYEAVDDLRPTSQYQANSATRRLSVAAAETTAEAVEEVAQSARWTTITRVWKAFLSPFRWLINRPCLKTLLGRFSRAGTAGVAGTGTGGPWVGGATFIIMLIYGEVLDRLFLQIQLNRDAYDAQYRNIA